MNAVQTNNPDNNLFVHVENLMTEHGLWPMLSAMARAVLQRRKQRRVVLRYGISDHLLRDIGLHQGFLGDAAWERD